MPAKKHGRKARFLPDPSIRQPSDQAVDRFFTDDYLRKLAEEAEAEQQLVEARRLSEARRMPSGRSSTKDLKRPSSSVESAVKAWKKRLARLKKKRGVRRAPSTS
jgi:hypothetical protein